MPVEPIPCADGGGTTPIEVTTCCAPSIASTPLCRADGTTVLLVVRSGCVECGEAAPDPVAIGWIDVATGTFTAGAIPADAGPCDAGCVDTVCRQLCDDTDGDGIVDASYSELWCVRADGTAELVLTYQDDPSVPYVPVAPLECSYGCPQSETVMLCDTAPDGTVTPFLRRYSFLNGTASYEDVELDGQTPHVGTGTVAVCAGEAVVPGCAEQTTPTATLGLCLADGTPIAVLITRDCDGLVTQDGWVNLTTGTFSTGAPPAGAQACSSSRAFELAGLLCDVDPVTGDVYAPVLAEYEYNDDGSLASVRLVDPGTGATYVLQGDLEVCPAGPATATADQDLTVLCDVQPDGTSTPFLRDYRRNATTGEITGHTDYSLDGTPYSPTGTAGTCSPDQPEPEPCRDTSTVLLCDLPTGGTPQPAVTGTDPTPYYPFPTGVPVSGAQVLWDGGTLNLPAGTGPQPGTTGTVNSLAATVQAPRPACDTGTARVAVSLNVQQTGPDDGCLQTGHLRLFVGTTQTALTVLPSSTPAGWFGTVSVEADVPAADLAAGNVAIALALDAYDDTAQCAPSPRQTGWQLSALTTTVVYDQTGCAEQILRTVLTDCETGTVLAVTDTTLDGQPYTVTGEVGQCQTAGDGECCPIPEAEPCGDTEVLGLCDLTYDPQAPIPTPARDFTLTGNVVTGNEGTTLWFAQANQVANGVAELTVSGLLPATLYEFRFASAWIGAGGSDPVGNAAIYRLDILDGATVLATRTRNVSNGSNVFPGGVLSEDLPPLAFIAPATGAVTIRFTDQTTGGAINDRDLFLMPLDVRTATLTVTRAPFLRRFTFDCDGGLTSSQDLGLDGTTPYTVAGEVGQCAEAGGDGSSVTVPPCDANAVIQACRCDDTDSDGIADTDYVELLGVDCEGALTSLGTYTAGLTVPYVPVAPIDCAETDEGAEPAVGVQARRVEIAAGETWDAEDWTTLQSVTAIAHGGTGTVTTADGPSTLHTGEAATWSVSRDTDALLTGPLTVTADTGTVSLSYTIGVTL
ncbi:hypothetical protein ACWF94_31505 [Streptomyces sp. NPDC055078]